MVDYQESVSTPGRDGNVAPAVIMQTTEIVCLFLLFSRSSVVDQATPISRRIPRRFQATQCSPTYPMILRLLFLRMTCHVGFSSLLRQ